MPGTPTPLNPVPSPAGAKSFEALLGDCIEAFRNFHVSKQPLSTRVSPSIINQYTNNVGSQDSANPRKDALTKAAEATEIFVDLSSLHAMSPSIWPPAGSPAGRNMPRNLEAPPTASFGGFKLKKNTVKLVSTAGPASRTVAQSSTPPITTASPSTPSEAEKVQSLDLGKLKSNSVEPVSALTESFAPLELERAQPRSANSVSVAETNLKNLFNRLVPDLQAASLLTKEELAKKFNELSNAAVLVNTSKTKDLSKETIKQQGDKQTNDDMALLNSNLATMHTNKRVDVTEDGSDTGLKSATQEATRSIAELKVRIVSAIAQYINESAKVGRKPVTTDFVSKALEHNFLDFFAILVEHDYVTLDRFEQVVELCKVLQDNFRCYCETYNELLTEVELQKEEEPTSTTIKIGSWPAQEKREAPAYRTCFLKGVSYVKNINQLQALVWGGKLQSISMPSPGSTFAVVKFLTPDACEKYLEATANGIKLPGTEKLVLVEKASGPDSLTDVFRNCIKGDITRCVRANDADEDWSDMMLMKIARGYGKMKREVDRIKRGKTVQGRYYIEFRFSKSLEAMNFRRQLQAEEDWDHCTIDYAPDPCETACGVHYKDEDE